MTDCICSSLSVPISSFGCCDTQRFRDYHLAVILSDSFNNKLVGKVVSYSESNYNITIFYDTY